MVQRFCAHFLNHESMLQTLIDINVSEAEFYAPVHGAAHGLGAQGFFRDFGLGVRMVVGSEHISARSFASVKGLGRQSHVQTCYRWIRDYGVVALGVGG